MKHSIDLGRWTTAKAAPAIAGALMIGGAVGSALAISPVISPPIKWGGGFEGGLTEVSAGNHLVTACPRRPKPAGH